MVIRIAPSMETARRHGAMAKADLRLLLVVAVMSSTVRGAAAADERNVWNYIQIHAWLMWASMGFLFPLGAILVRFRRPLRHSDSVVSPARATLLLYLHATVQCAGVGAATAGTAILLKEFGATLHHTHMKLGLALWIIAMMMPVISISRPSKGSRWRPYWLFVHWLLGTGVLALGIVNCFIGIKIYQFAHGSIRSLNIAFSVQVAVMALVYCLQDRLSYILGQGPKHVAKVANNQSMTKDSSRV